MKQAALVALIALLPAIAAAQTPPAGTGIGDVLGPLINFQGSGFPGLLLQSRLIIARGTTSPNDFADVQLSRNTSFVGGSPSLINSQLRALGNFGAGDATQNWVILGSGTTNGTAGGLVVGVYGQGVRSKTGTDPVWGMIAEGDDLTDKPSSASGSQVIGIEIDDEVNGADDKTNGTMVQGTGVRVAAHIAASRKTITDYAQTQVSYGLWITTSEPFIGGSDPDVNYGSAVGVAAATETYSVFDARGAIPPSGSVVPVYALNASVGEAIELNGGTAFLASPSRTLMYDGSKLVYKVNAAERFAVNDAGVVRTNGIAGVTCAAGTVNLSTFAVTNGIVTHC